jgi:hypothetical protein
MDYFKNMLWFYAFSYRFTLHFMAARPLTFFASPKKVSKERRPRLQVWLRQTSLIYTNFSGGCELAALKHSAPFSR